MKYLKSNWFFLVVIFFSSTANSATVLPLNLDELTQSAQNVFVGTCLDNKTVIDSATQMMVTYTTFQVDESLKGDLSSTYTIKQISAKATNDDMLTVFPSVPEFIIDQQYVVFFPAPSELGFASPVGLKQGAFDIIKDKQQAMVSNGRSFTEMLPNNTTATAATGQVTVTPVQRSKQSSQSFSTREKQTNQQHMPLSEFLDIIKQMEAKP